MKDDGQRWRTLLERGKGLRRQGRWLQAEELFSEAGALRPELLEPLLERARLSWSRGDLQRAEALLREAAERHPGEARPLLLLGRLLLQRRLRLDEAAFALKRAADLEPGWGAPVAALARVLEALGNRRRAAELMRRAAGLAGPGRC